MAIIIVFFIANREFIQIHHQLNLSLSAILSVAELNTALVILDINTTPEWTKLNSANQILILIIV